MANNSKIMPKNVIKILGLYLRDDLKMDTQIGKLNSILHNRIYELKQIKNIQTLKLDLCAWMPM